MRRIHEALITPNFSLLSGKRLSFQGMKVSGKYTLKITKNELYLCNIGKFEGEGVVSTHRTLATPADRTKKTSRRAISLVITQGDYYVTQ